MIGNPDLISFSQEEAEFPELLTDADIQILLSNQKTLIRQLDRVVTDLLQTKHKLWQVQDLKDRATLAERNLGDIYDLLDDKISDGTKKGEDISVKQNLIRQCEQLIARNERIKKNIADDQSACRYLETKETIDPLKVTGSLIGFPLTAAGITKILESGISKPVAIAMTAGGAIGIVFSFHRQMAKGWRTAANSVCKNGRDVRDSFMLYYVKQRTKEVASSFVTEARNIASGKSKFPVRVQENTKKIGQYLRLRK